MDYLPEETFRNQLGELDKLFDNLYFREEFAQIKERQKTFREWVEQERQKDGDLVSNYFFKIEPISISIQVNTIHL